MKLYSDLVMPIFIKIYQSQCIICQSAGKVLPLFLTQTFPGVAYT